MRCERCKKKLKVGDWPYCPHGLSSLSVVDDTIIGGMTVENLGGMTFYSKTEWRKEVKRQGLIQKVQHVPKQGSDKSRQTQRWV